MVTAKVLGFDRAGQTRFAPPDDATPLRCWNCSRVLAHSYGFSGRIELHCKRCRKLNVLTGEGILREDSRAAAVAQAVERREALGFPDSLRPSFEQVIEVMEERWRLHLKRRAKHSAEIAVGVRFDVLSRDNFRCKYCGVSVDDGALLHVDHVMPRSRGGSDSLDNLVTACLDCNLGKSDKLL